MGEADVIGVRGTDKPGLPARVFACEVSDHLHGFNYGRGPSDTVARLRAKFTRANDLLSRTFPGLRRREFMFWSVYVSAGLTTTGLRTLAAEVEGTLGHPLTLVINEEYGRRVGELWNLARTDRSKAMEEAYRFLQILARMRGGPFG